MTSIITQLSTKCYGDTEEGIIISSWNLERSSGLVHSGLTEKLIYKLCLKV